MLGLMRISVALGFCVASGCGAFSGSDAAPNAVGGDAGDGGPIATSGDGGALTDAPPADAGTWCASQGTHAFCADFDEGLALTATFNEVETAVTGESIKIDAAKNTSAPNSLAVVVPKTSGGGKTFGNVVLPSAPNGFTCAFDIALDGAATNVGSIVWAELDAVKNVKLGIDLVGDTNNASAIFGPPGSKFTRMDLTVNLVTHMATASRNGSVLATVPLTTPNPGTRTIHFGTLYPNTNAPFTLHYDNIVCDPL